MNDELNKAYEWFESLPMHHRQSILLFATSHDLKILIDDFIIKKYRSHKRGQ